MENYLKLSPEERAALCRRAEPALGLPAASLEKDFWVTWTLRELFFLPDWGTHLTFKGGTSLSKGWGLIERFSEDLDVVVERARLGYGGDDFSSGKLNKLRQACQKCVQTELLPALKAQMKAGLGAHENWSLDLATEDEDKDLQTLLFRYPAEFGQTLRYMRPVVKIELGARSDTDPHNTPALRCLLAQAPGALQNMKAFPVRTVAPRRTFWEKAMLLHEETQRPKEKPLPSRLSRHYYDLWCLIKAGVAEAAAADAGLFERVTAHRRVFFRHSWVDYTTLKPGSLRLMPTDARLAEWRRDYNAMREEMFAGEQPSFEQLLKAAKGFEEAFNQRTH